MTTNELIEALDQRYGNPYTAKENALIQEAIQQLRNYSNMFEFNGVENEQNQKCNGK
jgi:hypothetical protein